ncbi:MAG: triose-phosphate isomerase [bacterium]
MKKTLKPLIIGNWKLTPNTLDEAKKRYLETAKAHAKYKSTVDVVVCPPASFIAPLSLLKKSKTVSVGAQNVSFWTTGSKTGEISASQVRSCGATCSIVGHSERRALGETDEVVAEKVAEVVKCGMTAVVCIGETERDEEGAYLEVIKAQIKKGLARISKQEIHRVVIAYEPVWAIGRTDNVAITSHDLHQMAIFIHKYLKEIFGMAGDLIRIIYGGSVTPENAFDLYQNGGVSGFLPGRSSWDAKTFEGIFSGVSLALKEIKKATKIQSRQNTKTKVHKRK